MMMLQHQGFLKRILFFLLVLTVLSTRHSAQAQCSGDIGHGFRRCPTYRKTCCSAATSASDVGYCGPGVSADEACEATGCDDIPGCRCDFEISQCFKLSQWWPSYVVECKGDPLQCSDLTNQYACENYDGCSWTDIVPTVSPTEAPTQTGTWWYTQRFLARIRRRAPWNSDSTCAFGPQIVEITCNDPSSTIEQVAQATTIFPITQTSCTVSATSKNTMTCEIPGEEAGPNFNNPGRWYVAIEYTCYGTEITTSSMVYKASQEVCNLVLPLPSNPNFSTALQLATWCGIGSYGGPDAEDWSSDKVNMVCGSEVEFQGTFTHYSGTELHTCYSLITSFDRTTAGTQLLSFPEITMGTVEDTYYLDRYRFCVAKEFIADVDVVGGGGNNASPTAAPVASPTAAPIESPTAAPVAGSTAAPIAVSVTMPPTPTAMPDATAPPTTSTSTAPPMTTTMTSNNNNVDGGDNSSPGPTPVPTLMPTVDDDDDDDNNDTSSAGSVFASTTLRRGDYYYYSVLLSPLVIQTLVIMAAAAAAAMCF